MKKLFTVLILLSVATFANAQVYGYFDCNDPDAWFDKEIYFMAQNNATNIYGCPMNLGPVTFRVNGDRYYSVDYWAYGTYVYIVDEEMDKGTTVQILMNGQVWYTWTCNISNPTLPQYLTDHKYKNVRKAAGMGAKVVFKVAKRLMKYIR